MSPVVSVIIPVFNGEKYLVNTIKNVCLSSYKNIELILVDDGSSDNSYKICREMACNDSRIQVFHQENQGIIAARNKGIEKASGDYICFCDQDDIVQKNMYEFMMNAIIRTKCEMCICSTGKYINGKEIAYEQFTDDILTHEKIFEQIILPIVFDGYNEPNLSFSASNRVSGTVWKCMILKEVITENKIKFKRFINFEDDLLFLFDCLSNCIQICTLKYTGYYWRINSESESYRWRYVENLNEKEQKYYLYLQCILKKFGASGNILNAFKKCFYCTYLSDLIDNEGSPQNTKNYKQKLEFLRKQIYALDNYQEIIKGRKNFEWGLIRKKIVLMLLERHLIRSAFFFNMFYRRIKKVCIRFKVWTSMEKIIRRK